MLTPEDNDKHRRVAYKLMDACKLTGTGIRCNVIMYDFGRQHNIVYSKQININ